MQPRGGTQGTAERPSADAARMAALARIGAQLAAATDLEGLTEVITDRAASVIGASAAVLAMRDGPDRMRTIGSHGLSPTLVRRWATFPLAVPSPLSDAVRSGCTVTLSGRVEMAERYPDLDDGIDRSSVSLPLLDPGTGRAVGAVGFRFDSRHEPLDPGELSILTVLTDMCAQTMLRLQAETQSADRAARLEFLAHASEALAASLDYRQTLGQVASLAVPTHADWCSVQMVDDGVLRTLAVAHADPTKVQLARELETRWPPDPKARSGAAEVARTGRSLLVEEVTDEMLVAAARDEEHLQLARELGLRSAMSVPLDAHGQVLGVLTLVGAESGRRYTRADLSFAEDLARRAALAIDNADLYSQTRRTAAVLKATLLPQEMPEVEGWQLGTVYRQAGRTDVGGDFYDVSDLGGGRVSAVLGDVMGRGIDAAVAGSRMRSAARVLATQDPDPSALAEAMDRLMTAEPPTPLATAAYLMFEPEQDSLSMVVAGHPPPLLLPSGGPGRFVTEGSPVLGLGLVPRPSTRTPFSRGDLLLVYTDGLVERRGEGIEVGLTRLQEAADRLLTEVADDISLDEVLTELVDTVTDPDRHDDVAVVAFRRTR